MYSTVTIKHNLCYSAQFSAVAQSRGIRSVRPVIPISAKLQQRVPTSSNVGFRSTFDSSTNNSISKNLSKVPFRRNLIVKSAQATTPVANKQKAKNQRNWLMGITTGVVIAAFILPYVLASKPTLLLIGQVLLALSFVSYVVEMVCDWLYKRKMIKSGEKDMWILKAKEIGMNARERAANTEVVKKAKAANWEERNVNGAATEEDVKIIRELNEFLE